MHYIPELKLGYDQLLRPLHKTVLHYISNTLRIACIGIFSLKRGTVLFEFFHFALTLGELFPLIAAF